MAEVRACDPVSGGWTGFNMWEWDSRFERREFAYVALSLGPLHVTLANGQRIIVRALSEERKAARLARKIRSAE